MELPTERRDHLRLHPKDAITAHEKQYVVNYRATLVDAAWKSFRKAKRSRNKPELRFRVAKAFLIAMRVTDVKPAEIVDDMKSCKALVKGLFKQIDSFDASGNAGTYKATAILKDGAIISGAEAWTGALAVMTAGLNVAFEMLERQWRDLQPMIEVELEDEKQAKRGPSLDITELDF